MDIAETAQRITLGLYLDGQRGAPPSDCVGEAAVGPSGLLGILETQLGLVAVHPSAAERTIQYRDCLAMLDAPSRFYHRSFALDPIGTAAYLLGWRDEWAPHRHEGQRWEDALPSDAPSRLRDLAAVEQRARAAVSPNIAERLKAIEARLKARTPAIESIRVIDPVDTFPACWQAVLKVLPVAYAPPVFRTGAGFLGALQQRLGLAAAGEQSNVLAWQDDATVIVVQAETRTLAAHWVASRIAAPDTLLVEGADGTLLDAHLAEQGQARQGLKETSAFRPSMQVLPLVTELLWAPLNYYALVQFLTHPVCPLPGFARRRLAEKMADAPGIGGAKWQQALEDIAMKAGSEHASEVSQQIAFWVEHPRFDPEVGAPLAGVTERVGRLVEFFRHRLGDTDEARRLGSIGGYTQCQACLDALSALSAQGDAVIRPRQLQKIVAQATGAGTSNPLWPAEVGAGQVVNQPGAAIHAASSVIWWQLTLPELPGPLPWSAAEVRALEQAGVSLPAPAQQLERIACSWLRPVMAAREQLVLVLPPVGEEVHPLWQMIAAVVDTPRITTLEDLLASGGDGLRAVAPMPLAAPKRWWQLPADVHVTLRPRESFSSLEQLLFDPYRWLLRYPAALRPSKLVSLGNDFLLFGNLAHALIERYFQRDDALAMSEDEFEIWFGRAFDALIDQEGALLRMPGRGAELAHFRRRLLRALHTLRSHVRQAGVAAVVPEQALEGRFEGGELAGFADLVMHKTAGAPVVVDMKWSGGKKYPEKLRLNRHLQLAIYAELFRQQTGQQPAVAYYLLDRARLLAPDDRGFPEAEVIPSDEDENTALLWQRFLATWRWRVAQIRAGRFELVLEATSAGATEDSEPPQEAMAIEILNEAYNDYRTLAGWSNA